MEKTTLLESLLSGKKPAATASARKGILSAIELAELNYKELLEKKTDYFRNLFPALLSSDTRKKALNDLLAVKAEMRAINDEITSLQEIREMLDAPADFDME